ncbi:SagB-type dehydrogenase family enzyme [Saccharopolyspora lacisalsi]|uniref:SagB-type dehydrogenase family enzyme n=1 Tax=Halosaccharopolyspora lacisalsi TaxID=1000566 RepID=A0A839DWS7_9PSEU|nr:SagB family peptide dehydrogenase [Halosaccharopolyspora lacisalsi]MBA8826422.1 SagB-type dehydrogenase family enzyme [Halosaccharopolyspora lacisalsi]
MNTVPPTATEQPAAPGDAARTYMRRGRDPAPDEIDWSAAPARFLSYTDCPVLPLPWASRTSERPDTELLGRLLRELCGLTRADWTRPMDPFTGRAIEGPPVQGVFRPAPSGGALYPIEVYLATGELPRVPAALHHYGVVHHSLRQVRSGDHRAALVDAVTAPPDQAPDVVLALTAVFWRSAFKYGEFAYRLLHQETGALLAQVRAVARLLGAESAVHLRFPDEKVNQLLGLDTFRQTATAVIALRHPALRAKSAAAAPSRSDLLHRPRAALAEPPHDVTSRLPITAALHAASLTEDPEPVSSDEVTRPAGAGSIRLPSPTEAPSTTGVSHRHSASKGFRREPIEPGSLAAILDAAGGHPEDLGDVRQVPTPIEMCCAVSRVPGVPPGVYRYTHGSLERLRDAGSIRYLAENLPDESTRITFHEAAVALFPLAAVGAALTHHGDRGYRLVQIETGALTHRAALASAALGVAARIHSGGACENTDRALGLRGTRWSSETMLLIGAARSGQAVRHRL